MERPLVLVAGTLSHWLSRELRERYEVHRLDEAGRLTRSATVVVTTGMVGLSNAEIDALPALRLVAIHGVGHDKVDVSYARGRGILVTNTPDVLTDDVADLGLALILATARRVVAGDRFVRDGAWERGRTVVLGRKVTGARFGIVGLGRIGAALARRLQPLSDRIAYHNRSPVAGCRYRYVDSLPTLASESDFLIVTAAGGPGTDRLVDAPVLEALGPGGFLINVGRGSIVDEAALLDALEKGVIAGAGLDVFADEPHVHARFRALDQVVLQPHQASATVQTRIAMAELVLANVAAYFSDHPPPTPV